MYSMIPKISLNGVRYVQDKEFDELHPLLGVMNYKKIKLGLRTYEEIVGFSTRKNYFLMDSKNLYIFKDITQEKGYQVRNFIHWNINPNKYKIGEYKELSKYEQYGDFVGLKLTTNEIIILTRFGNIYVNLKTEEFIELECIKFKNLTQEELITQILKHLTYEKKKKNNNFNLDEQEDEIEKKLLSGRLKLLFIIKKLKECIQENEK